MANLATVRLALARLILPEGYFLPSVLGRSCLWEMLCILYEAIREELCADGDLEVSLRRLGSVCTITQFISSGAHFVPTSLCLSRVELVRHCHRLMWPPFRDGSIVFVEIDRLVAHWPLLRALVDHRLIVFVRNSNGNSQRPNDRCYLPEHGTWLDER